MMDFEPDFTHIEYVDQQTCDDGEKEGADSWLAVNVTEMDEADAGSTRSQTMDSSFGKRHLEPLQIPNEGDGGDKRGRTYIYDSSPIHSNTSHAPNHSTHYTVSPPANTAGRTKLTPGDTSYEEEEQKISFLNFSAGSIALFVPVDANKTSWMAFHSNRPNRFLAEESVRLFTQRNARTVDKTRILAKIVSIHEHVVPYPPAPTALAVRTAATTGSTGSTGSTGATGATGATGSTVQGGGRQRSLTQIPKEWDRNPHHLAPGTVYYECFAEPVTVVKRS